METKSLAHDQCHVRTFIMLVSVGFSAASNGMVASHTIAILERVQQGISYYERFHRDIVADSTLCLLPHWDTCYIHLR